MSDKQRGNVSMENGMGGRRNHKVEVLGDGCSAPLGQEMCWPILTECQNRIACHKPVKGHPNPHSAASGGSAPCCARYEILDLLLGHGPGQQESL